MIKPSQSATFLLALALASMALLAQPEEAAQGEQSVGVSAPGTEGSKPSPTTPDTAAKKLPSKAGNDSPFDYRPSEEISEDVPVSFPVDI